MKKTKKTFSAPQIRQVEMQTAMTLLAASGAASSFVGNTQAYTQTYFSW